VTLRARGFCPSVRVPSFAEARDPSNAARRLRIFDRGRRIDVEGDDQRERGSEAFRQGQEVLIGQAAAEQTAPQEK
jgi:hypothetical protein